LPEIAEGADGVVDEEGGATLGETAAGRTEDKGCMFGGEFGCGEFGLVKGEMRGGLQRKMASVRTVDC